MEQEHSMKNVTFFFMRKQCFHGSSCAVVRWKPWPNTYTNESNENELVVDYGYLFTTHALFESKEELISWVHQLARSNDMGTGRQRGSVATKSALNMMLVNTVVLVSVGLIILTLNKRRRRTGVHRRTFTILDRIPAQMKNMSYLCEVSNADCRDQLRMDRATFHKLCFILRSVCGLKSSRRVCVSKKVAMFLSILSHHTKNRCVKFAFKRSGETVSKHFHSLTNDSLADTEFVDSLNTTTEWTSKRDEMALNMFNEWRNATAN
ncbi:hypothetical protein ACS0TY_014101 [Phlomoides rotata]